MYSFAKELKSHVLFTCVDVILILTTEEEESDQFRSEVDIDGEFRKSPFCNSETLMNLKDANQSGGVAGTLVEFLEVAINMIVFLKGFYPSGAFERRRYMNVVVQRARHPELRDYIHSATTGLLPFIQKDLVERVAVIFFSKDNVPVERFIFKLTINSSSAASVEEGQLEFALRSFLIKLSASTSLVKPLPQNCRWEVTAYVRSLPEVGSSKEGELWIPTDTKQWQKPPVITPVKSLNSEPLSLQLYLEHPCLSEPQPCQAQ